MKKIAILYPAHFEQSSGGAEIQVKYLHDACLNCGFEVYFIYEEKGSVITPRNNVYLYPLKKKIIFPLCGKGWFLFRRQIRKTLETIQPDVIYTRLGSSWVGFAAEYAQKYNIRHIHAMASDNDVKKRVGHKPFYPLFSQIETYFLQEGLRNATTIIAQNIYQQQVLKSFFKQDSIIVNQMTSMVDKKSIKKDFDKIKIIWVANFKKIKRPELFVELAEKLYDIQDQVEMYMCGRCPQEYISLKNSIKSIPHLHYLGPLSQNEVFDLMSHAHILVNTSEYEGFSNTFVQSWMRQMCVISMNSNPNNILTDKHIGYIEPTLDAMNCRIRMLTSNLEELKHISNNAYDYAVNNHSLERNMDQIINVL